MNQTLKMCFRKRLREADLPNIKKYTPHTLSQALPVLFFVCADLYTASSGQDSIGEGSVTMWMGLKAGIALDGGMDVLATVKEV